MKFKDLFSCSPSVSSKKFGKSRPPPPVKRDYYYHPGGGHPSTSGAGSATAPHNYSNRNPYDIVDAGDFEYSGSSRVPASLYDGYYDDHRQKNHDHLQQQPQRTISHSLSDSSGGATSSSSSGGSGASSRCSLRIGDRIVWFRDNNDFGSRSVEFGTVRWIGFIQDEDIAGIEFDQPLGLGSGWYKNQQLFTCEPHHGGLVAVAGLLLEEDYLQQQIVPELISNLSPPCKMPHASPPRINAPLSQDDCERFSGRNKGIQGHRNSCYLDATLFSMFSFSSVFDSILIPPLTPNKMSEALVSGASSHNIDPELGNRVRQILREQIVNPLRKDLFTPAANMMKLRENMQHLDSKIISEEMDPQEYLHLLFNKVLHLPEFLSLSLGQDDYFHQVIITATASDVDKKRIPSVQSLLEQSFMGQKLKFKTIPNPALILLMPRSGNKYRTYDGILPNLTIDITDLLQDTPRMCAICGELAVYECPDCYGMFPASANNPTGMASDSTSFCNQCVQRVHCRKERNGHTNISKMEFSFDPSQYFSGSRNQPVKGERNSSTFLPSYFGSSSSKASSCTPHRIPRITMDLFAVICIETSHFVSFVKCGPGREAPWVFFDSMADRIESSYDGNSQGQNIPNVKHLAKMGIWLDKLEKEPGGLFLETLDSVTAELKRLITDSYICLYYSPQSSMYA